MAGGLPTSIEGVDTAGLKNLQDLYNLINGSKQNIDRTSTTDTNSTVTRGGTSLGSQHINNIVGGVTVTDSDRINKMGERTDTMSARTNYDSGRTDRTTSRKQSETYDTQYDSGNTVDLTSRVVNATDLTTARNLDQVVEHTGHTDVSTTDSGISQAGMNAMLREILEGNSAGTMGLSAVSSGQRLAGGYGSSINTLLTNDLMARSASQVAQQQRHSVTTNAIQGNKDITSGRDTSRTFGNTDVFTNSSTKTGPRTLDRRSGTIDTTDTTNIIGGSSQTLGGYSQKTGEQVSLIGGGTRTTSDQHNTTDLTKFDMNSSVDTTNTKSTEHTNQNNTIGGVSANGLLNLGGAAVLGQLLTGGGSNSILNQLSKIISGGGNGGTGGLTNGGNGGVDLHSGGNTGAIGDDENPNGGNGGVDLHTGGNTGPYTGDDDTNTNEVATFDDGTSSDDEEETDPFNP